MGEEFKRKLTAILSADVAGYSRLMGEDEAATVKTLEQYKGIMSELIRQHRGREVDSPGDNLLVIVRLSKYSIFQAEVSGKHSQS